MLIFVILKINKGIPPIRTIEGYENVEIRIWKCWNAYDSC